MAGVLNVLITNVSLVFRAGTELYVRDLAHGLRRAGHVPVVYSPQAGKVAHEIRAEGIAVVDDLDHVAEPPDIIHGHHALPAMEAVVRFPGVPAIYVVHDRLASIDTPPVHPRIRRYVAVDDDCIERLAAIPSEIVSVIHHAVDLERFRPRGPLPDRPRRALLFSNDATEETVAAAVRQACERHGVALDLAGFQVGAVSERPEALLGEYDVVFGKARCAIEALAVGCAVVLCDVRGVGGLVTPSGFARMRRLNFGMKTLVEPVAAEVLEREIARYDAAACAEVSARARVEARLEDQVAQFVALYRDVLAEPRRTEPEEGAVARFLGSLLPDERQAERLRAEIGAMRRERDVLATHLRDLQNSGTMKLREKLLRIPLVGRVGRRLARVASRPSRPSRPWPPMPVIVGVPRSGTTLLRMMLDSHREMAVPPETGWMPGIAAQLPDRAALLAGITDATEWVDFHLPREALEECLRAIEPFTAADGVRAFYRLYAARFGKPRWGDKTPGYGLHMEAIERLLPEAHFIHIIRDGRDVSVSVRGLWFRPGDTVEAIAKDWCDRILEMRAQGARCRHFLEVRYEDLVRDPEAVLRRVCTFVDLQFDAAMLDYHRRAPERLEEHEARVEKDGREVVTKAQRLENQHFTTRPPQLSRIGRWRGELAAEEVARFEGVAGRMLRELGYETSSARTESTAP